MNHGKAPHDGGAFSFFRCRIRIERLSTADHYRTINARTSDRSPAVIRTK